MAVETSQDLEQIEGQTGFDREEVGEPVGPMPPKPPSGERLPAPEEIVVRGDAQLSMFDPGGKKPTRATLTLRGKTVELEHGTVFRKGARVRVEAVFVVDQTGDKDSVDKSTGTVTDCTHKLSAFVEDVRLLESA